MKLESKYNIGDKVWVTYSERFGNRYPYLVTIGQVRVEVTDSPGIEGEETFDNYKPQKAHKEQYMCVETGIGSGSLWEPEVTLFATEEECQNKIDSA